MQKLALYLLVNNKSCYCIHNFDVCTYVKVIAIQSWCTCTHIIEPSHAFSHAFLDSFLAIRINFSACIINVFYTLHFSTLTFITTGFKVEWIQRQIWHDEFQIRLTKRRRRTILLHATQYQIHFSLHILLYLFILKPSNNQYNSTTTES